MATLSAIDPACSAVVWASAGTGKTHLLISRLLRLLLAGADPARILAITFTRKAAGEMRERLLGRLHELAQAAPARLAEQLQALDVAPGSVDPAALASLFEQVALRPPRLQTFHSFCLDLLRRFPLHAEVPAGFTLLEATGPLLDAAWERLCAAATAQPRGALYGALEQLFDGYRSVRAAREALVGFVEHRADWWAYTQRQHDPCGYALARAREWLGAGAPPGEWPPPAVRAELSRYRALLEQRADPADLAHAERLGQALQAAAGEAPVALLWPVFFARARAARRRTGKAAAQPLAAQAAGELQALREQLGESLARQRAALDAHAYLRVLDAWYTAGSALLDTFQDLKQRRALVDFVDLEWQAVELLHHTAGAEWVQFKLDERIDHVLVDEFQDTNPTQWRLLLPILEEMMAGGERARSVFIVGDEKQSIYGFRRANPELQRSAAAWLTANAAGTTFTLERSRRAAPALIEAVNRTFGGGASRLASFTTHDTHLRTWGRVELLAPAGAPAGADAPPALRDPLREAPLRAEQRAYREEGARLARRIGALIEARVAVVDEHGERPLRYGDIMLLVRSRTHVGEYERALRAAGVPFVGADQGTLLEALEVRDIEALLQVLASPGSDLALAQVLRSPLFGAGHEMLGQLALHRDGSWFERLLQCATELPDEHPLRRAATLLPRWRALLGTLPTHDLLNRIYHEADALARYRAALPPPLGERSTRNLLRLAELALETDSGRYPSALQFLRQLRDLRNAGRDAPSEPAAEDSERLRLMTVHAAKGLEAPVVVLADAAAAAPPRDAHAPLIEWPAAQARPLGFLAGLAAERLPEPVRAVRERLALLQQREEHNLLYVAMTRARHLLVVSATRTRKAADDNWFAMLEAALSPVARHESDDRWVFGDPLPVCTAPRAATALPPVAAPWPHPTHATAGTAATRAATSTAPPGERHAVDAAGRTRGQAIHRILQTLSDARLDSAQARALLGAELAAADELLDEWFAEAQQVLDEPDLQRFFAPECYQHAWNEVPITFHNAGGGTTAGVIDRLLQHGDSVTIIDYKTHRLDAASAAGAAQEHAAQLRSYAEGVRAVWPRLPVRAFVLFTALRQAIEVAV